MSETPPTTRAALRDKLIIAALASVILGLLAGILTHSTGDGLADSFLAGGKTFAIFMTLCVAVIAVIQTAKSD